jgi:hypothetical protein
MCKSNHLAKKKWKLMKHLQISLKLNKKPLHNETFNLGNCIWIIKNILCSKMNCNPIFFSETFFLTFSNSYTVGTFWICKKSWNFTIFFWKIVYTENKSLFLRFKNNSPRVSKINSNQLIRNSFFLLKSISLWKSLHEKIDILALVFIGTRSKVLRS